MRKLGLLTLFLIALVPRLDAAAKEFRLSSPTFTAEGQIPVGYTCDGANLSPALRWEGAPKGTQSFALIIEDPDAPKKNFTHWTLYDLPPAVTNLPAAIPPVRELANGEIHGTNDFGKIGYGGPCPPKGEHRYTFKIYALDIMLRAPQGLTKAELLKLMKGHVLAKAAMTARYKRAPKKS